MNIACLHMPGKEISFCPGAISNARNRLGREARRSSSSTSSRGRTRTNASGGTPGSNDRPRAETRCQIRLWNAVFRHGTTETGSRREREVGRSNRPSGQTLHVISLFPAGSVLASGTLVVHLLDALACAVARLACRWTLEGTGHAHAIGDHRQT